MKKILITGGSGLVGSSFIGEEFIHLSSKDGDLRNKESIKSLIEKTNPEGIIHCAAKVGGVLGNTKYPGDFYHDNIMMNTNVIEEAKNKGIKKLVFFSSTCVFPDEVEYPLSPEKIHLGPPHQSNYAYAYAKRMGQVQIQAYKDQHDLNYFTVIPTNIYGPNDSYDMENGHVLPSLIHKMYLARESGEDFIVWGSGNPLREFIFSEDVAKLTMNLYRDYNGNAPVILSTSNETSIKNVVLMIADIFDFKGNIKFDTSKPEGQYRKPSDNSVIRQMYPDFKFTQMREGLEKSINWFIENYKIARK
jgi:GDP-L-fucose synthase